MSAFFPTRSLLLAGVLLSLAATLVLSPLADDKPPAASEKVPSDLAFITPGAPSFLTLRPADIAKDEVGAALLGLGPTPWERLGLKHEAVERATLLPRRSHEPLIIRTLEPLDRAAVLKRALGVDKEDAEEEKVAGRTVYTDGSKGPREALHFADDRVLVFGTPRALEALFDAVDRNARPGAPFAAALKEAAQKHPFVWAGQPERVLDQMGRPKRAGQRRWPAEMLPYKPLLTAGYGLMTVDLGETIRSEVRFDFASDDAAKEGETCTRMLQYVLRELSSEMLDALRLKVEGSRDLRLAWEKALGAARIKQAERSVSATLEVKLGKGAGVLVKGLAEARLVRASENNLKQMIIAMHAHHDANNRLPSQAIVSKDGKPLLSWRVAILPYIEQEALFKQFKLDEPWDSKHNKKLLAKMPRVYAPVVGKPREAHSTYYQVFTGPNTTFPKPTDRPTLLTIFDGTSNTMAIVEAAEAVPWTKPADLVVEAKKPLPRLGGMFKGFFCGALWDGSVRRFRSDFDQKVMRLAIDPGDGMPVDLDEISAK